jgi:hypothetical protein
MKTLGADWITDKHIDFEYKKYVLLDYLQDVNKNFEDSKLYPALSDLVFHYRNLLTLKENKAQLFERFPEHIQGTDVNALKWIYKKDRIEDTMMKELEEIIDYSLPQLEKHLNTGKRLYDNVEEHLNIIPVGLTPLYALEGYFFLQDKNQTTRIYEYQITLFEKPDEIYRGIHTQYLTSFRKNLGTTYENIKLDLIRKNKKLPNPATYAIETDIELPLTETYLPIAKRVLVKYIN